MSDEEGGDREPAGGAESKNMQKTYRRVETEKQLQNIGGSVGGQRSSRTVPLRGDEEDLSKINFLNETFLTN